MQRMTIYGVSFDMVGKQPIVLLKTVDGNKFLPIWIGHPEAAAILMKLQGASTPRPLTHDLLTDVLRQLEARVVKITVTREQFNGQLASLQEEIVGSLNADERIQDLLVPVIVRRLKSLSAESTRLAAELERRYHALRTIASRTKCAERLSHTCEQQHARACAEKELRDIIERIAQSDYASLP